MKVTREMYQQSIPACCEFKTVEEHEDNLMLCWGLVNSIKIGKVMNCKGCEFNKGKGVNAVKQLQEKGFLLVDKEGRFGNKYTVVLNFTIELPKNHMDTLCLECGESTGEDAVETIQGVFCDNECFSRHVLDDAQIEENYGKK